MVWYTAIMKIDIQIASEEISKIKEFYQDYERHPFVQARKQRNLEGSKSPISKEKFWHALTACLLTTQQRSGPKSAVSRFLKTEPFPLSLKKCNSMDDIESYARKTLKGFGGIRRGPTIAVFLKKNFLIMNDENKWKSVAQQVNSLIHESSRQAERKVAEEMEDVFYGIGPKQARNLLQMLGYTRYEIPIDSRVIKWLNRMGFPIKLSGSSLADRNYYCFVLDVFQTICDKIGIPPCLLDAAIFASFDSKENDWQDVF